MEKDDEPSDSALAGKSEEQGLNNRTWQIATAIVSLLATLVVGMGFGFGNYVVGQIVQVQVEIRDQAKAIRAEIADAVEKHEGRIHEGAVSLHAHAVSEARIDKRLDRIEGKIDEGFKK